MDISPQQLTAELKAAAREQGFAQAGVCAAATPTGLGKFQEWIAAGYAGQMHYLPDRAAAYEHPRHVLAGVRSILVLTMNYATSPPAESRPGEGRIARYAWGTSDYHDLIHPRLKRLVRWLEERVPGARSRGVVDTAPLLERELAQLAGLGWIGKNSLLLNRAAGSWFFLAALLTDVELTPDEPHAADHCGTCTACLDACPTDAFVAPTVLDASRCVSYLTIELRQPIPHALRPGVEDWLFGCDVCQDVCPWNNKAPTSAEPTFAPQTGHNPVNLVELFTLDDAAFRARFRQTPLWRARRRGVLRNAAIALGNRPTPAALPALVAGLADTEPLVRGASAWALGRFAREQSAAQAQGALEARICVEDDPAVREEISRALAGETDLPG